MSGLREKIEGIYDSYAVVSQSDGNITISDEGWREILAAFKAHIEGCEMPDMAHILSIGYDADPYQSGKDCANLAVSADRKALMGSLE